MRWQVENDGDGTKRDLQALWASPQEQDEDEGDVSPGDSRDTRDDDGEGDYDDAMQDALLRKTILEFPALVGGTPRHRHGGPEKTVGGSGVSESVAEERVGRILEASGLDLAGDIPRPALENWLLTMGDSEEEARAGAAELVPHEEGRFPVAGLVRFWKELALSEEPEKQEMLRRLERTLSNLAR